MDLQPFFVAQSFDVRRVNEEVLSELIKQVMRLLPGELETICDELESLQAARGQPYVIEALAVPEWHRLPFGHGTPKRLISLMRLKYFFFVAGQTTNFTFQSSGTSVAPYLPRQFKETADHMLQAIDQSLSQFEASADSASTPTELEALHERSQRQWEDNMKSWAFCLLDTIHHMQAYDVGRHEADMENHKKNFRNHGHKLACRIITSRMQRR